jgi:acetylornithine deacetylase/succinyl-diaminopimelate desuccinylase-like protein
MPEMIIPELNEMLQSVLGKECTGNVFTAKQQIKTHTGVELAVDDFVPGYELSTDDEWFVESRNILGGVLGRDPLGDVARFTCDANRLYQAGIPTVIFGPGDISVAHTTNESISIEQLLEGVVCYMALVL